MLAGEVEPWSSLAPTGTLPEPGVSCEGHGVGRVLLWAGFWFACLLLTEYNTKYDFLRDAH